MCQKRGGVRTCTMWACEMPLASSVRARRTARLLPRASITTTFALGRSCTRHPVSTLEEPSVSSDVSLP